MASDRPPIAEEALHRLISGNHRFSAGQSSHPHQTPQRRLEIAAEQRPFAAILGCADSRLPPEIIFDQGLGDLYVVRVAGNIADPVVLGSLEIAVEALGLRLIVVLGHDHCAAVARAVKLLGFGASPSSTGPWTWQHGYEPVSAMPAGHIGHLVAAIKPAVDAASARAGSLIDNAIDANVDRITEQLKSARPILAEYVAARGLRIVGARYSLKTGAVSFRRAP